MTETTTAAPPDDDLDDDFRTGGAEAQARQEGEAAARKAARGQNEYLTSLLKDSGDSQIIRWITDEKQLIEVMQHYVPTKPAPADKPAESKWPDKMSAVCRKTERRSGRPWYDDCFVCDHMRDSKGKEYSRGLRMWGIAVIRKRVVGTKEMVEAETIRPDQVDSVIGMTDDLIEVDEIVDKKLTGNKVYRKHYVIVNMGLKNFFSQFVQFARPEVYGTLLDRDYLITRTGKDTDTEYRAAPLDVIAKAVKDDEGKIVGTEPFDLRNPKFAALYEDHGIDLPKIVKRMMGDEYYGRFFDTRVTSSWKTEKDGDDDAMPATTGAAAAATDASGPTQEKLANMRNKILNENPGRGAPAGQAGEGAPASGLVDLS